MDFAQQLQLAQQKARTDKALRSALLKAGAGLAGLALLPVLAQTTSFAGTAARMLAALVAASTLAFFALKLLANRTQQASAAQPLKVIAKTALSPKTQVAVIEADGQRLVIAFGDGFAQLLSNKPQTRDTTGDLQ